MMEAVLLVGGQGTRLRPLTIHTPKPMLPVAGVPCTEHQIARAREAGVTRIVLGTSYRAEVFREYFGNGSAFGVELIYAVEEHPLGTGGAIRNVTRHLQSGPDDPVLVFNGDVLTGVDLTHLVAVHRQTSAAVTLYLTRVPDPRAFGLVPTDEEGRVTAFLEKPTTQAEIVTDQINAGCYVFRRSVISAIPTGRPVSVERETFPKLLADGARLQGVVDEGYWLDLGTPLAFVRGSADLVTGRAPSPAVPGPRGEALVLPGAEVSARAKLTGGTVVGSGATVGPGAQVDGSVLFDGAVISSGAVVRESVIGADAIIGAGVSLDGVVVGDRAMIGPGNELTRGARVWPGVALSETAVRFSSDR
ncbi:MAG: NDP-sugar synthase [Candidatus Nanopelagicales bacterium]